MDIVMRIAVRPNATSSEPKNIREIVQENTSSCNSSYRLAIPGSIDVKKITVKFEDNTMRITVETPQVTSERICSLPN